MDIRSMRESNGISVHFIVRTKIRLRFSVKWQKRKALAKRINYNSLETCQTAEMYRKELNYMLRPIEKKSSVNKL